MRTHQIISLVLISLITLSDANNLGLGDECQVNKTGKAGICKFTAQCPEVQNDLRFNGKLPTSCGYKGSKQIVCCSNKEETDQEDVSNLPISVRKCKEYSRYVFTNNSLLLLAANAISMNYSTNRCGHVVIPLIIGGSLATAKEFPHSALLGYRMPDEEIAWDCGGSLVSTRYVLTAAHCLSSPKYSVNVSVVRLGELVLYSETDESEVIDVSIERFIAHPNYSTSFNYNDIALIKLNHKVKLSPFVRPICLPTYTKKDPHKGIATGWGLTEFYGNSSKALLKVVLESYSTEECNDLYQYHLNRKRPDGIIETQLCAGSRNESRDTCQGDSGGPLQIYNPDPNIYCMYTQVGITSFGVGCGSVNFPGVYTRVYNYVQWIEDTIWAPDEED